MSELVTALGLVLVIEGLLYAFAPDRLKAMMAGLMETPSDLLRTGGLAAMALGVVIVWAARTFLAGS